MDRTLKCDHSLESCRVALYCGVALDFTQFVILENVSILNLALSGVKGLRSPTTVNNTCPLLDHYHHAISHDGKILVL